MVDKNGLDILCYYSLYCWLLDTSTNTVTNFADLESNMLVGKNDPTHACYQQRQKFGYIGPLMLKDGSKTVNDVQWLDAQYICENKHPFIENEPYDSNLLCQYPPRNPQNGVENKVYCDDTGVEMAPNLVLEIEHNSNNYEYDSIEQLVDEWKSDHREPYEAVQTHTFKKRKLGLSTIPDRLGDLTALKKFVFKTSEGKVGLTGTLPVSISKLQGLQHFEIQGYSHKLEYVDLYNMNLGFISPAPPTDSIPQRFQNLGDIA